MFDKSNWLTEAYRLTTFRHTFGTILNANGENPKVIQQLIQENLAAWIALYRS